VYNVAFEVRKVDVGLYSCIFATAIYWLPNLKYLVNSYDTRCLLYLVLLAFVGPHTLSLSHPISFLGQCPAGSTKDTGISTADQPMLCIHKVPVLLGKPNVLYFLSILFV
jgi:hypothetical protein